MNTVRVSKYRHVYGKPVQKEKCHDNIRLTKNAFDSNFAKANPKYVSLNWQSSGGGSFAVLPHSQTGKLPDRFPLFDGHKGAVLDTDWNPFDDECVVSASDDGTIGIWRVPENLDVMQEAPLDDVENISPVRFLKGHGKRVGHVLFNPVAENILASSGFDNTIRIWDLENDKCVFTLQHPQLITSFAWSHDGSRIASACKDKHLRVWDVRAEKVLTEGTGHLGTKSTRLVWLGDHERLATTGFSRMSEREMALWDTTNLEKGPIGDYRRLDPSSGVVIPFYDWQTSILYLGGRGDGKIVYYEFVNDDLFDLFVFQSTIPQRGLAFLPDRALNVRDHEVARIYKVHENLIEPIPFYVPRKAEGFLDGIYTVCHAKEAALTAEKWISGKTEKPLVYDWKTIWEGKEPKGKPLDEALEEIKKANQTAVKADDSQDKKTESSDTSPSKKSQSEKSEKDHTPTPETKPLNKADKQESNDVLQAKDAKEFLAKAKEDSSSSSEEEEEDTWNANEDEDTPVDTNSLNSTAQKTQVSENEHQKDTKNNTGPIEPTSNAKKAGQKLESSTTSEKEDLPAQKSTSGEKDTPMKLETETAKETENKKKANADVEPVVSEKDDKSPVQPKSLTSDATELARTRVRQAEENLKEAESFVEEVESPIHDSLESRVHSLMATVEGLVERIEKLEANK